MSYTLTMMDGDLYDSPSGQLELLSGVQKTAQDLGMFLMCDKYGKVSSLLGKNNSTPVVKQAITDSVELLIAAQDEDESADDSEKINDISELKAYSDDSGGAYFSVNVTTNDNNTVTIADGLNISNKQPGVPTGYSVNSLEKYINSKLS